MSADEVGKLKKTIYDLEEQLKLKSAEVITYRQELKKFSQKLDELMIQLSDESHILSSIQKIFIPTELPKVPGYEFSRKFVYGTEKGGDYFDIFEHENKFKFGVLVSSASGYAMSALFLSLILKYSSQMKEKTVETHQILQKIASELAPLAGSKDQSSVFFALFDRRDCHLSFCNVGNNIAFKINSTGVVNKLSSGFDPISQVFNANLNSIQIEFESKDRICILTEGILEILSESEICQIIEETRKVTVHDLRNELLFRAQKKSGLSEPKRDQTVVVIEAKDQVIKLAK